MLSIYNPSGTISRRKGYPTELDIRVGIIFIRDFIKARSVGKIHQDIGREISPFLDKLRDVLDPRGANHALIGRPSIRMIEGLVIYKRNF